MLAKRLRLPINTFPARARILYQGQYVTVKTTPNHFSYTRIGVIITRKTASKATERNRLRRKIFDLFREETRLRSAEARKSEGGFRVATAGKDLLVLVKPIKLDAERVEKLLEELSLVKQRLAE